MGENEITRIKPLLNSVAEIIGRNPRSRNEVNLSDEALVVGGPEREIQETLGELARYCLDRTQEAGYIRLWTRISGGRLIVFLEDNAGELFDRGLFPRRGRTLEQQIQKRVASFNGVFRAAESYSDNGILEGAQFLLSLEIVYDPDHN